MAEEQLTEKAEAQAEPPAELEQLQTQLAQLETQRADYEAQVVALRGNLAQAVGKYRARLLAEAPEVPEELVRGDTPEEVEASFATARQVVERIKQRLETQVNAERVPAGAPARGLPDLSALSPAEKIAYGLARH
jgi:outer membrane protein TolC